MICFFSKEANCHCPFTVKDSLIKEEHLLEAEDFRTSTLDLYIGF